MSKVHAGAGYATSPFLSAEATLVQRCRATCKLISNLQDSGLQHYDFVSHAIVVGRYGP
jgi:hypothetical protein